MKPNNFDEIAWLNSYFDNKDEIIKEEIEKVLYFSLMWNTFETLACDKFARIPTIERKVNDIHSLKKLIYQDFAPYLTYFSERYFVNGDFNQRFENLRVPDDRKELVKGVLSGELTDINNIVLALLIIVYRLRNNLFHGEKSVYKLRYQDENFSVANQLLAVFLNLLK